MTGSFAVLLSNPPDLKNPSLAGVLAAFHGVPALDIAVRLRKSRGLLGEDLQREEADRLAQTLAQKGLSAVVKASGDLFVLPPAQTAVRAQVEGEEFYLRTTRDGEPAVLPFADLAFLGAFALEEGQTRTTTVKEGPSAGDKALRIGIMMATGLPIGTGKSKEVKKEVTDSELVFSLMLVGKGERWQVPAEAIDYRFLKERMTQSVFVNFRSALNVLAPKARGAVQNAGLRILLAGQPVGSMGYESLEDVNKEARWLLSL